MLMIILRCIKFVDWKTDTV